MEPANHPLEWVSDAVLHPATHFDSDFPKTRTFSGRPFRSPTFVEAFSIDDLIPYMEYDCPLNDLGVLANIVRIIFTYAPVDICFVMFGAHGLWQGRANTKPFISASFGPTGDLFLIYQFDLTRKEIISTKTYDDKLCKRYAKGWTQEHTYSQTDLPNIVASGRGRDRTVFTSSGRRLYISWPSDPDRTFPIQKQGAPVLDLWRQGARDEVLVLRGPPTNGSFSTDRCHLYAVSPGGALKNCVSTLLLEFPPENIRPHCSHYDFRRKFFFFVREHTLRVFSPERRRVRVLKLVCLFKNYNNHQRQTSLKLVRSGSKSSISTGSSVQSVQSLGSLFRGVSSTSVSRDRSVTTPSRLLTPPARPPSAKLQLGRAHSANRYERRSPYSRLQELEVKIPEEAMPFFTNARCHFLFRHDPSHSFVLLVKNVSPTLRSLLDTRGTRGRILIKLLMDWDSFEVDEISVGAVDLPDERCRIVAYDDIRSTVVVDTLRYPTRPEVDSDDEDDGYDSDGKEVEYGRPMLQSFYSESISAQRRVGHAPSFFANNMVDRGVELRVLRLNDIVRRWKVVYERPVTPEVSPFDFENMGSMFT